MMNGGALYTDVSGNLPELSSMTNFVAELTGQLENNREAIKKINKAADRVVAQEKHKIEKLRESYKRHCDDADTHDKEDEEADSSSNADELFEESIPPSFDNSKSENTHQSEARAPRKTSKAEPQGDSDVHTTEGTDAESTRAAVSQKNLNLRITLQRLEQLETRMTDLIKRFEGVTGSVRDGSQDYVREYKIASQTLVDSYESRLDLERQTQQKLLATRGRMLEELANLTGIVGQSSRLMGNDIKQKLQDSNNGFVRYTTQGGDNVGSIDN